MARLPCMEGMRVVAPATGRRRSERVAFHAFPTDFVARAPSKAEANDSFGYSLA